jgi:uncharacterized membrane protein SirB2
MDYAVLKLIHISAAAVSFLGFVARGLGALQGASWVRHRLTRTLPHAVDTVLLLSALGMLSLMHLSPLAVPWLQAKIAGLLLYIALGVVALRTANKSPTRARRLISLTAWIGALVVFGYIVSVAVTKNPRGALIW